jgi:hypothetical protein
MHGRESPMQLSTLIESVNFVNKLVEKACFCRFARRPMAIRRGPVHATRGPAFPASAIEAVRTGRGTRPVAKPESAAPRSGEAPEISVVQAW